MKVGRVSIGLHDLFAGQLLLSVLLNRVYFVGNQIFGDIKLSDVLRDGEEILVELNGGAR